MQLKIYFKSVWAKCCFQIQWYKMITKFALNCHWHLMVKAMKNNSNQCPPEKKTEPDIITSVMSF